MSDGLGDYSVLPADSKTQEINWQCYEVSGAEIVLVPEHLQDKSPNTLTEGELEELKELTRLVVDETLVREFSVLRPGTAILCYTLFERWEWAVVDHVNEEKKNGAATSSGGGMIYFLSFDEDERHCWACTGSANLTAIKRWDIRR